MNTKQLWISAILFTGLSLTLAGCGQKKAATTNATTGTTTTGKLNTTATITIDGTGLIVMGGDKQVGDSLSPTVTFEIPIGITTTAQVATLKAENLRVDNHQAGGKCTTPDPAKMTTSSLIGQGLDFSFTCTTTGAYIEGNILNSSGSYDPVNNFKYAGLQPKDINRTFSFDLVVQFNDGTYKKKTLTGSFDAAKVIEGLMQNGAKLDGIGTTM